jgi:hypothetical protein
MITVKTMTSLKALAQNEPKLSSRPTKIARARPPVAGEAAEDRGDESLSGRSGNRSRRTSVVAGPISSPTARR